MSFKSQPLKQSRVAITSHSAQKCISLAFHNNYMFYAERIRPSCQIAAPVVCNATHELLRPALLECALRTCR